jgi:hypothetical protein
VKHVVITVLFLLLSIVPAAGVVFAPRAGEPVAVFFAPGTTEGEALSRVLGAGGLLLSRGVSGSLVVVLPGRPDFVREAYRAGAIIVIAAGDARGCQPAVPGKSVPNNLLRSANAERYVQ